MNFANKSNDKLYDAEEASKHKDWYKQLRNTKDCEGRVRELRNATYRGKKERRTNGFVTYNAAHMGVGRSHQISSKFIGKTVAIQRTKRKSNEHVLFERTRHHVVFHFPNQGQKHNDAAGAAIMIPKEDMEMEHTIGYSTDMEIKGRGG